MKAIWGHWVTPLLSQSHKVSLSQSAAPSPPTLCPEYRSVSLLLSPRGFCFLIPEHTVDLNSS